MTQNTKTRSSAQCKCIARNSAHAMSCAHYRVTRSVTRWAPCRHVLHVGLVPRPTWAVTAQKPGHGTKTRSRSPRNQTRSRHQNVCRDTNFGHPTASVSRRQRLCHDTPRLPLPRHEKSCLDQGPTWSQPQPCRDIKLDVAT